eukprot:TRINITY_DN10116_c0_g1_i1.p2 TRINITY_DN10116_c0_g1~~TRINITY_DN10116_c0_g1_i1.p2  ORF type:complete len:315 (+),score=87.89 TRINITY_DN10116_c0_g1_i1:128-1072(+)
MAGPAAGQASGSPSDVGSPFSHNTSTWSGSGSASESAAASAAPAPAAAEAPAPAGHLSQRSASPECPEVVAWLAGDETEDERDVVKRGSSWPPPAPAAPSDSDWVEAMAGQLRAVTRERDALLAQQREWAAERKTLWARLRRLEPGPPSRAGCAAAGTPPPLAVPAAARARRADAAVQAGEPDYGERLEAAQRAAAVEWEAGERARAAVRALGEAARRCAKERAEQRRLADRARRLHGKAVARAEALLFAALEHLEGEGAPSPREAPPPRRSPPPRSRRPSPAPRALAGPSPRRSAAGGDGGFEEGSWLSSDSG